MKKIDWTKWSAIAEILSAIAIVATLAYLSVQTQYLARQTDLLREQSEQTNELLRAQARYNLLQNRVGWRESVYRDPELAEFTLRALAGGDSSQPDLVRFRFFVERQFLTWQWEYSQFMDGNLAESELAANVFAGGLQQGGFFQDVWQEFKSQLRPDFVSWVDTLMLEEN